MSMTLFTRKQAAERLGISMATLDRLTLKGTIDYVDIGLVDERRRYTERALADFIAKQTKRSDQWPAKQKTLPAFSARKNRLSGSIQSRSEVRSIKDLLERPREPKP